MADPEVVFTPAENFAWDTSYVVSYAKELLAAENVSEWQWRRLAEKAAALEPGVEKYLRDLHD